MEKAEKTIGDLTLKEVVEIKKYCEHNCWTCTWGEEDELEEMYKICKKENPLGYAICGVDISTLIGDDNPEDVLNKKISE